MTSFVIPAQPVPASRPRVFRNGAVAYTKKHYDYKTYLEDTLPALVEATLEGPVSVVMEFVMPPFKTSAYPAPRQDIDNLAKLPMDAMTKAGFWTDDSLVVEATLRKRFARPGEETHTFVKIAPATLH